MTEQHIIWITVAVVIIFSLNRLMNSGLNTQDATQCRIIGFVKWIEFNAEIMSKKYTGLKQGHAGSHLHVKWKDNKVYYLKVILHPSGLQTSSQHFTLVEDGVIKNNYMSNGECWTLQSLMLDCFDHVYNIVRECGSKYDFDKDYTYFYKLEVQKVKDEIKNHNNN